jgi:hypothetical protein
MHDEAADRAEIRALIENWALWRDAGWWDRLRTVWHPDGRVMATWFQGSAEDFITTSREGFARAARVHHTLGGTSIDVAADRAIAQTRMTIMHRGTVEGVACDFTCIGRFYDFFEKRGGRWGLVLRQPIYEKDRLDPVVPGTRPDLDRDLLMSFPEGYRYLAYLQTRHGFDVKRDMPGFDGPQLDALYRRGERWLKGEPL